MLDQRDLAHPHIGLAQPHSVPLGRTDQPLAGPMHQLGVGRKGDRLLLHGRVDDDLPEVGGLGGSDARRDGQALLNERDQLVLAHALAPAGQRRAIKRQFVLEELLTAEQLIIRVLKPALAQDLVGEVMHVLEDGQAGHQPRRQRRASRTVRVDRPTPLLEKAPVDRPYELHERVIKVDDLVEPGSEEITLPRLPTLHWPHESPRRRLEETRESRPERRINLQESQSTTRQNRQSRILPVSRSSRQIKALGVLHGRLVKAANEGGCHIKAPRVPSVRIGSCLPRTGSTTERGGT
jgi:hypothetical protein